MPLIAASDNQVTYTCSEAPDTAVITVYDSAGATVASGGTITGSVVALDLTPAEVPQADLYTTYRAVIEWTADGLTRTDEVGYFDVLPDDTLTLATLRDLRHRLNIGSEAGEQLYGILKAAQSAIAQHITIGPRITEVRRHYADGSVVYAPELVSVTSVVDLDGNSLAFTEAPGNGEHLRWVELDCRHSGLVAITGVWGYEVIPWDIARAVVETAATWYMRDTRGEDGGFIGRLDSIPKQAHDLIAPYKVRVV